MGDGESLFFLGLFTGIIIGTLITLFVAIDPDSYVFQQAVCDELGLGEYIDSEVRDGELESITCALEPKEAKEVTVKFGECWEQNLKDGTVIGGCN